MSVTLADIEAAADRIKGYARRTPLLSSPLLDKLAGRRIFVKPECLQITGSFKFRGAFSAISALPDAQRQNGIVAFSSGNHAQGIAHAATLHGVPSVIIMPADAPKMKIDNTKAYGAEVILYDRENEDRDEIGARVSGERNLTLVKPFDEPMVIAGQGTTGLEIAEDAAELGIEAATVLVPCGGGGLTSGIALACAGHAPGLNVRPCEPEGFDDVRRSLISGGRERNNRMGGSICDAIVTPSPGEITFPLMQAHCGAGLAVSEDDCLRAMAVAFEHLKVIIEPGGAVALAAALYHPDEIDSDTVICVASGGNVDAAMFQRALDMAH